MFNFINGIINFPFGSRVFIKHIAYSVTKSKVSESKYGSGYLQPKVSKDFGRVAVSYRSSHTRKSYQNKWMKKLWKRGNNNEYVKVMPVSKLVKLSYYFCLAKFILNVIF